MMHKTAMALAIGISVFASARVQATVITVGSSKDNTIYKANPNYSLGAGPGMFVGANNAGASGNHRALIAFDLSAIPKNAVVTDVQLKLVLAQVAGTGGTGVGGDMTTREITIQRLLTDWGEGSSGQGAGVSGSANLFDPGDDDATWNSAKHSVTNPTPPSVPWSTPVNTPGGLFADAISSSAWVNNPGNTQLNNVPFFWNATPTLLADVQGWVQNPGSNFGWIVRGVDESAAQSYRAFWTKEAGDSAKVPMLEVTFTTVPEPMSIGLAAMGILLATCLVRRSGRRL